MELDSANWLSLLFLVFVLGLKHGMDADHLATIDGLTRYNARKDAAVAPWCGVLFSLGHGTIVIAIAILVGAVHNHWVVPAWLESWGAWASIVFLMLLGALNLQAVFQTPRAEVVYTRGIKGRLFGRLQRVHRPFLIAGVGVVFALSFDTVSQATLFAFTGAQFGGWLHGLALGLIFTLGMLVADGMNGLWVSRLMRRADQVARVASRVMGLTVGILSLLVAAFGMIKYFAPDVSAWTQGKELIFGLGVVGIVTASFVVALWLVRDQASRDGAAQSPVSAG
jgi:high-affinity nickel-transport protein